MSERWTAEERETVITTSDGDDTVHIWTAQRRYITALMNDPSFTFLSGNREGENVWAEFSIPSDRWTPKGRQLTRKLTEERRAVLSARMSEVRNAKENA